jgi:hypothetical protein
MVIIAYLSCCRSWLHQQLDRLLREIVERFQAARSVSRDGAQQLGEFVSRARVEATVRTARQSRDLAESIGRDRVCSLLKDERRNRTQTEFAGHGAKVIDGFFHGIANENECLHFLPLVLPPCMSKHLADLGYAAAALDRTHQIGKRASVRDEARRAAFVHAPVVHELNVQATDRSRLAEHFGLQLTRDVPRRLPAQRRIESKDQPRARTRCSARGRSRQRARLLQERVDFCASGGRRRSVVGIAVLRHCCNDIVTRAASRGGALNRGRGCRY